MRFRGDENPDMADSTQLAVLAALNIANEYRLLKTKLESQEGKQRTRERHQRHHTQRSYEKQLLAIANGEVVPTNKEYKALIAFGRVRGWHRRPPHQ